MATYDLTSSIPAASSLAAGDILNCPYSGAYKTIELPKGTYKLQCWGAQGGSYSSSYYGGKGGYAIGTIILNEKSTVYLYAGGQGASVTSSVTGGAGGFNGGGKGGNGSNASKGIAGSGGGGASDIRINSTDLTSRVIVAGGGGGSSGPGCYGSSSLSVGTAAIGGAAGVAGNNGGESNYHGKAGGAGTTSGGGAGGAVTTSSTSNKDNTYYAGGGGGGGAGYYGGGGGGGGSLSSSSYRGKAGSAGTLGTGGAGGASYSSGKTAYYGSGGGSGGGGSSWTSSNLTSASSSNGNVSFVGTSGSNETGHTGNGYVRITAIEVISTDENGSKNLYIKNNKNQTLPSSYTQLPYIEKIGAQYIDTNFIPNNNTRVIIDIEILQKLSAQQSIFGGRDAYQSNMFSLFTKANNAGFQNDYGTVDEQSATSSFNAIGRLYIDKNKNVININNEVQYVHTEQTFTAGYNLYLGSCGSSSGSMASSYPSYLRIYSCKIYDNGTLIRDYIPALRNSDNKAGLYDLKNSIFYTDATGGNFIYNYNTFIDSDTIYYLKGNSTTTNLAGSSYTVTNNNVVATPNDLLYFNGSSYLSLGTNYITGTNDWTIDWWEYRLDNTDSRTVYHSNYAANAGYGMLIGYSSGNKIYAYATSANSTWNIFSGLDMGTLKVSEWVHRAMVRKGNNFYTFENGKLIATTSSSASIAGNLTPTIGFYDYSTDYFFYGYLKHLRISKVARWTGDFTPPDWTMGHNSNYSKIKESYIKVPNNQTASFSSSYIPLKYIESNGTQWINTGFTPNNNSSFCFDVEVFENDDHAAICTARGTDTNKNTIMILKHGDGYWCVDRGSTASNRVQFNKLDLTGRINVQLNKHHISFNKGEYTHNYSKTDSFTCAGPLAIFYDQASSRYPMKARLYSCKVWDNRTMVRNLVPALRKSDNIAGMYDTVNDIFYTDANNGNFIYNILDIDTNTKLLLNGALTDASGNNTITNTNTQIVNTGRVNDTSLYFNGSALINTNNYNYVSGTNNFTVEWWEYPLAFTSGAAIFQAGTDYGGLLLAYQNGTTGDLYAYAGSNTSTWDIANGITMGTMKLNQWTHRAVSRHGNNFYFFENGKLINTTSSSGSINTTKQQIGGYTYSGSTKYFQGYIDGFRITQNARWTNDFTPSSSPYGDQWKKINSIYIKTNDPFDYYTHLEYLESTGTQYIDTGIIPTSNTKIVLDCVLPTTSDGSYYICGAREESYVDNYALQTTSGIYYTKHGPKESESSLSIPSVEHRMKLIKDGHTWSVDGTLGYCVPADFTCKRNMYLFCCNSAGSTYGLTPCKIYRVRIYLDGETLSRDMVPTLRNSDGKTGFYDLVNNAFHYNLDTTAEFNYIYSNGWDKIT